MAEVEDDEVRLRPWKRPSITRRGHKMQVTLAKVELAMDGLVASDRLLVLNQAVANVLYDAAGGQ